MSETLINVVIIEPCEPTSAAHVPWKIELALHWLLDYEHFQEEKGLPASNETSQRHAPLRALS
jgi:hypothetical protein